MILDRGNDTFGIYANSTLTSQLNGDGFLQIGYDNIGNDGIVDSVKYFPLSLSKDGFLGIENFKFGSNAVYYAVGEVLDTGDKTHFVCHASEKLR